MSTAVCKLASDLPLTLIYSFASKAVVTFLHSPNQMESIASEQVRHKPNCPEKPPLRIREKTGQLNEPISCLLLPHIVPYVPSIVLQDLVVH